MCRSIHVLRLPDRPATPEEIRAAALQYVRKVSGYRKSSQANAAAFEQAVLSVEQATAELLQSLKTRQVG